MTLPVEVQYQEGLCTCNNEDKDIAVETSSRLQKLKYLFWKILFFLFGDKAPTRAVHFKFLLLFFEYTCLIKIKNMKIMKRSNLKHFFLAPYL